MEEQTSQPQETPDQQPAQVGQPAQPESSAETSQPQETAPEAIGEPKPAGLTINGECFADQVDFDLCILGMAEIIKADRNRLMACQAKARRVF